MTKPALMHFSTPLHVNPSQQWKSHGERHVMWHTQGGNPFNSLFSKITWIIWHYKGWAIVDFNEARDDGVAVASAGPYFKSCAPCSRQITMPSPQHSIFYRPHALPDTQPTVSKHWRQCGVYSWCIKKWNMWMTSKRIFNISKLAKNINCLQQIRSWDLHR